MRFSSGKRPKQLNPATVLLVKQFLLGLGLFVSIALILTAVWHISRLDSLTITAIEVKGGKTIEAKEVVTVADSILNGTYLGLVPRRFAYFYPEEVLYEAVKKIDRIKDVTITLIDNKTLNVTYDEYVPEALWCAGSEEERCFFLAEDGYAFGLAPNLSGGSFVRYYSLEKELEKGISPFMTDDFKATREFVRLLGETGWYVEKVEIDSVRDVFYTLGGGSELKATLLDDVTKTFSHLMTIRQSEEFTHLVPGGFQYIDLRFGTKVYVNEEKLIDPLLQGTSSEAILAETATTTE